MTVYSKIQQAIDELNATIDSIPERLLATPEQIDADIRDGKRCSIHGAMMPCAMCKTVENG